MIAQNSVILTAPRFESELGLLSVEFLHMFFPCLCEFPPVRRPTPSPTPVFKKQSNEMCNVMDFPPHTQIHSIPRMGRIIFNTKMHFNTIKRENNNNTPSYLFLREAKKLLL